MRYLHMFALIVSLACSTASLRRSESQPQSPSQTQETELREAALDSVVQFLLNAAATDFHAHRPPDPVRFRQVRLGHITTSSEEKQYLLCGQFQPRQQEGMVEWISFTIIKTSGYEQWLGGQAEAFCRKASVIWDKVSDLSDDLLSRYHSLK